ncbi:ATP-dependent DNA ligase [Thermaurantimonas aggregans]|uniref:DNA ligase (ATP) n=1 Tax=Thermaurantimonas aggregans TaxID=2173829 RepID=A0A401XHP6_9FLAO|nr:ATP-dependent DNA ligase [Thermaurantimonas aggregans]MCX8149843.1 ATP-dependent DNA ligase [Thermaurantimonas aggregans]GCD76537.1 ATP-dependent DNA ligase [Thermaurantimonas aggregans]
MKRFSDLIRELDQSNKTNDKTAALVRYFREADDPDKLWAAALFSGKRPRKAASSTELRIWAGQLAGLPDWLVHETWHIVGDLAETIAKILPEGPGDAFQGLAESMEFLKSAGTLTPEEKKTAISEKWLQMTVDERFVFNKLMMGGFRIGVSGGLLHRAISTAIGLEQDAVALALTGNWNPAETTWQALFDRPADAKNELKPYPFCLAYPLEDVPESLGPVGDWLIEYKWDGIRGQLIIRGDAIALWSRGEELISESFPELVEAATCLKHAVVLDGEILPVMKDGRVAPFHALQPRLGRKKVTKSLIEKYPVLFRVYDLLEADGTDMRTSPAAERRAALEQIISTCTSSLFDLSPLIDAKSWDQVALIRSEAPKEGSEGLMLKHKQSPYHTGRKRGDWWKWKVDARTVDAVLIYAQRGHGRRANLYTDYTFAVWDGDTLVPFTKAYSGLTDDEIKEVDKFIRQNTLEKFGPVRSVKPELVFEIAFEGIQPSNRHKAGVALRFPRIQRWRLDKKAQEADTLESLLLMVKKSQH